MSDIKDKVFEDEFMEVQSGLISLCIELVGESVDKIFVYCSIERTMRMFNAFFEVNGEIKTLNLMGIVRPQSTQFLRLGTQDLNKVVDICTHYDMKIPTEMKLIYDVKSTKFNAEYKYDEICSLKTGKAPGEVFLEWIEEMKQLNVEQ